MNDPTETQLTQSLADHAADAPSDDSLLSDVHTRLHRRRRARTTGAVVLACAAVATALTATQALTDPSKPPLPPAVIAPPPRPAVAAGWHWESYSNVQVQIPDSWQEGGANSLWACSKEKPAGPMIGRISLLPSPAMACMKAAPPVDLRVSHLFFDDNPRPGVFPRGDGWTEETRVLDGLGLTVFSDDDVLRRQILDSALLINGTDVNRCTPSSPLAAGSGKRPPATGGLASVGVVDSVQICAYTDSADPIRPPLLASAEITGDGARAVGEALQAAPTIASVMNRSPAVTSDSCDITDREILVLKVHGDKGEQDVLVRITDCAWNGFDDGVTARRLTKDALQPLLTAVGRPEALSSTLKQLLR
ncbi:MAG TPA: hypothetical protein VFG33_40565 [Kribbella sp.]|uniref:hypothetical protein n=1 Tax=Kribbella sp. TaxID=1871183 RepID=UPI002D77DAFC|nr:hypothetical protein [Kribbella sp.]HET6299728.1 hypothetical protein [Kribbella sp.]